jgi:hypothetical protein
LSAFATLVSLPTAGAPLSCRFAFNCSEQYSHRRPNQKPLLPRNRAHLALSQMWRPHGGHRETYGCPDPTPFSTFSHRSRRMIRQFLSLLPTPFSSPQHHSICISASPQAASFKQLYRTRPARRPEPTCLLGMGRVRYSTSVSRAFAYLGPRSRGIPPRLPVSWALGLLPHCRPSGSYRGLRLNQKERVRP